MLFIVHCIFFLIFFCLSSTTDCDPPAHSSAPVAHAAFVLLPQCMTILVAWSRPAYHQPSHRRACLWCSRRASPALPPCPYHRLWVVRQHTHRHLHAQVYSRQGRCDQMQTRRQALCSRRRFRTWPCVFYVFLEFLDSRVQHRDVYG